MTCQRCGLPDIAVPLCSQCILELARAHERGDPLRRPTWIGRFLHALVRRHDYAWVYPGRRACLLCGAADPALPGDDETKKGQWCS